MPTSRGIAIRSVVIFVRGFTYRPYWHSTVEASAVLLHRVSVKGNTRNRILVASLLLFNEHGEPNVTTNEIADEMDISPGNLHYHFRKREQIVAALLDEFQADVKRVLQPPQSSAGSIDDFWLFLHLLLELTAAYRFLFRDLESLTEAYPRVGKVLGNFARGLAGVFELYLFALAANDFLRFADNEARIIARNLAVIALFSERFDVLTSQAGNADDAALRVAGSILNVLKPLSADAAAEHLEELAAHYEN